MHAAPCNPAARRPAARSPGRPAAAAHCRVTRMPHCCAAALAAWICSSGWPGCCVNRTVPWIDKYFGRGAGSGRPGLRLGGGGACRSCTGTGAAAGCSRAGQRQALTSSAHFQEPATRWAATRPLLARGCGRSWARCHPVAGGGGTGGVRLPSPYRCRPPSLSRSAQFIGFTLTINSWNSVQRSSLQRVRLPSPIA